MKYSVLFEMTFVELEKMIEDYFGQIVNFANPYSLLGGLTGETHFCRITNGVVITQNMYDYLNGVISGKDINYTDCELFLTAFVISGRLPAGNYLLTT